MKLNRKKQFNAERKRKLKAKKKFYNQGNTFMKQQNGTKSCNYFNNDYRSNSKKKELEDITNGNHSRDFNFNRIINANVSQRAPNGIQNQDSFSAHKQSLPIRTVEKDLLKYLRKFETNIIIGETGSGKSTQIPQILYENGLHRNARICVTQPRKLAAINLAKRVAEEMECDLGSTVGYAVRFDENKSSSTRIKFVTDGMLLREALLDPLLKKYSWIILDEAHERTVNTDILFGIVKKAQRIRKKRSIELLKIVIMSATMGVDKFLAYFGNAKVDVVPGREHEILCSFPVEPQKCYFLTSLHFVAKIHILAPSNHGILVFLTGQEEIEGFVQRCNELMEEKELYGSSKMEVFPLYAQLPDYEQAKVFHLPPTNTRKIVISTNLAETSLTIPGIKYVIDSGRFKTRTFNPSTGFNELQVCKISQAQAMQRAGRAGRETAGKYYSVFTQNELESLEASPVPEILKAELSSTYLTLLAAKVKNPLKFDFMDKPPQKSLQAAEVELRDLGIITGSTGTVTLTELGMKTKYLPLKPSFAKCLLQSSVYGCTEEVLSIIALLSCESIYMNPAGKQAIVKQHRLRFRAAEGDHFALLNVYNAYKGSSNKMKWCNKNYLNHRNLVYGCKIREQLVKICQKRGIPITSCEVRKDPYQVKREPILKSLIGGLFKNTAKKISAAVYKCLLSNQEVFMHPGSNLFNTAAPFVLFTEVTSTGKRYMTINSKIDPLWLKELYPEHFCNIDLPRLENIFLEH